MGEETGTPLAVDLDYINLKLLSYDNSILQFKMKKHVPFRKLMMVYCDRVDIPIEMLRFRFDGKPITETDTTSSLNLEEGDIIEVYQQQTGGSTQN